MRLLQPQPLQLALKWVIPSLPLSADRLRSMSSRWHHVAMARTWGARARLAVVATAALLAMGCNAGAQLGQACGGGDLIRGWVGEFSDGAMFVTWTDRDGALSGSLDFSRLVAAEGAGALTVDSQSTSFDGQREDGQVTLSLQHGLGAVTNLSGEVDEDELTLLLPQADGALQTVTLKEGCSDTYNAALDGLNSAAAADLDRVANEAATEAAADEFLNAFDEVEAVVTELQQAADELNAAVDEARQGIPGVEAALADARSALEDLRTAVANDGGSDTDGFAVDDASYAFDDADYSVDVAFDDVDNPLADARSARARYRDAAGRLEMALLRFGDAAANLPDTEDSGPIFDPRIAEAETAFREGNDAFRAVRQDAQDLAAELDGMREEAWELSRGA